MSKVQVILVLNSQRAKNLSWLVSLTSDWEGFIDDMRSTSGYCFTLGSSIFSWSSKKQEIVAQSTVEAELIVATAAINQAL